MKRLILILLLCSTAQATWDVNEPKDTTQWNLAAGYIRDNWQALEDGDGPTIQVFNVKHPSYNATGDGVADDTDEIKAAITAADATSPDSVVYFPPGTYLISSTITVGDYDVWRGAGRTNSLIKLDGAGTGITMGSHSAIYDMGVDGSDTTGEIGISATSGTWLLSNVRVSDCDEGLVINGAHSSTCINCDFKSNVSAGVEVTGSTHKVNFIGCIFTTNATGFLTTAAADEFMFSGCTIQSNTTYGIRTTTAAADNLLVIGCHIESNGTGGEISIEAGGDTPCIQNSIIDMEDTDGIGINLGGTIVQPLIMGNRFEGGDADDVAIILGASIDFAALICNNYDTTNSTYVTDNTSYGYASICDQGDRDIKPNGRFLPQVETFGAADTTPSVAVGNVFKTDGTGQTLTDFDNGVAGQEITVISTDATVFDTTGTNLTGSSLDITTADGDVTRWICEDGTTWILLSFVDVSEDNSGGA